MPSNKRKIKICTACNFIGKETRTVLLYVVGPLVLILLGLLFLLNLDLFGNELFGSVAALIWLLSGIYTLILFLNHPAQCPQCNKRRTMIPLDTPRAQELIKEHNLSVPTSTNTQTNPNPEKSRLPQNPHTLNFFCQIVL
jgi:hypothetical protein